MTRKRAETVDGAEAPKKERKPRDHELAAISKVSDALQPLDEDACTRVIEYVTQRRRIETERRHDAAVLAAGEAATEQ